MPLYNESKFCIDMTCSKNFVNKDSQHPEPGIAMYGEDVVFSKEELLDGKWCFCNNDPEIIASAKIQVNTLIFYNTFVAIID